MSSKNDEESKKPGGDFTQLVAVSSLVSNQVEGNNGEKLTITVDHSHPTNTAQPPSSTSLPTPALQMRDELATKAALKEIDHKKIQDKSRKR